MKVAVVAGYAPSLLNFRRELLAEMVARGHHVVALAPEDDPKVRSGLAKMGVAFAQVPLVRNGVAPADDVRTFLHLTRFFRRHAIDVAFSYTIKPVVYGSLAAAAAGVPRVSAMITGLGYAFTDVRGASRAALQRVVQGLYRLALAQCDEVVFQNDDDRILFSNLGLLSSDSAVTIVNGSGVDVDYFSPTPLPAGPARFVTVARLLREKGIRELGEAAARVRGALPDASFELVGPTDPSPGALSPTEVERLTAQGIELVGPLNDVRTAIARANVFVLPSYREGTPRTVLEAMACGRPVVTTDVPGCRQTQVPGETGFLVPAQDPAALADAMMRFTDSRLRSSMGAKARAHVEEHYAVSLVAPATANAALGEGTGL